MTRKHLSLRQQQTVERLTVAAVAELGAAGFGDFTVRNVAKRAGVAPATAYTYFASKEHLVAEVFWRRFAAQPDTLVATEPVGRVVEALSAFALVVAEETELSAACTVAVLAEDPDVKDLRQRIGTELHRRLTDALGPAADPAVIRTLQFATAGALLQVGTGHLGYDALPRLLDEVARTVLGGTNP
jgi:AcrR family transcriptional regulator